MSFLLFNLLFLSFHEMLLSHFRHILSNPFLNRLLCWHRIVKRVKYALLFKLLHIVSTLVGVFQNQRRIFLKGLLLELYRLSFAQGSVDQRIIQPWLIMQTLFSNLGFLLYFSLAFAFLPFFRLAQISFMERVFFDILAYRPLTYWFRVQSFGLGKSLAKV